MALSLLDVTGPVMIGPSSSHTAGALKLGLFARAFLGHQPECVTVYLHGSFGTVYRGHATDAAIIAGLLGFPTDSEKVRDAFAEAAAVGMVVDFVPCSLGVALHPNTAKIVMHRDGKEFSVVGASIGGGVITITEINGFPVELKESAKQTSTIVVMHRDARDVLHTIISALSTGNNNIASIQSVRSAKNGDAMTIIETDERIARETLKTIRDAHDEIYSIFELN